MKTKKVLAALLSLALLLTSLFSLAACSEATESAEEGGVKADAESPEPGAAEEAGTEEDYDPYAYARQKLEEIPAASYDGASFGIASQAGTGNSEKEIWVEDLTGDVVNDAVFNRNLALAKRFDLEIFLQPGDVMNLVRQSVSAGDAAYKIAFPNMATATGMAQNGMLLDYMQLDNLNLTDVWWDQGTLAMDIMGKVYFMNGDINFLDNDVTYIQLFNKKLISDLGLDVPYDLVREGKWTIDAFREMCVNVTADLDGDGQYTDEDRYGYITTGEGPCTFFYGSGLTLVTTDAEGIPALDIDVEKTVATLEKVVKIISEDNITRIPKDVAVGKNMFMTDRVLFYGEVLSYIVNVREMETAFGVLPIPKYDEMQEKHYTYCNAISSTACVPTTSFDIGMITSVLEGMAIQSFIDVTPAYYEIALTRKYARDSESSEMLDVALANRVYDIGRFYSVGVGDIFQQLAAKGSTDFASALAKNQKLAAKSLERIVKDFSKLD